MLDIILKNMNIKSKDICIIGDSFESDIKMAQNYGADSILISDKQYEGVKIIKKLDMLLEMIKRN